MDLNEQNALQRKNTIISDIGLILVALFWGGGFVAGKFALIGITPLNQMAYRYLGACFIVFLFCIRKLGCLKNKKLVICGILCGANMFIGNSLQTIGLQYTTPGKQSFITSMYILLIPLITWLVSKKRPSNTILSAAVIGFIGIAFITMTEDLTIGKGDLMTFALAITFSAQVVFISMVVKDVDAMVLEFPGDQVTHSDTTQYQFMSGEWLLVENTAETPYRGKLPAAVNAARSLPDAEITVPAQSSILLPLSR